VLTGQEKQIVPSPGSEDFEGVLRAVAADGEAGEEAFVAEQAHAYVLLVSQKPA
jgi:hypothetical protein